MSGTSGIPNLKVSASVLPETPAGEPLQYSAQIPAANTGKEGIKSLAKWQKILSLHAGMLHLLAWKSTSVKGETMDRLQLNPAN